MQRLAVLVLLAAAACSAPPADVPVTTPGPWQAAPPRISGDIGPASGIDHEGTASIFDDGHYLSVQVEVDLGARAAMTRIASSRPDLFAPGLAITVDAQADNDLGIALVGCVGHQAGVWDLYDSGADEVSVSVGDDHLVTVDAILRADGSHVRTEFVLVRDDV
jgi:hypothetical protein